jgi:hypothetical protein
MPDEMDLSRNEALRRSEEEPLFCPCCDSFAGVQEMMGATFPFRVRCQNSLCQVSTPYVSSRLIAVTIWNRRVKRKPAHRLVDAMASAGHTRPLNAGKPRAGEAGGSQRGRPKRTRKSRSRTKS